MVHIFICNWHFGAETFSGLLSRNVHQVHSIDRILEYNRIDQNRIEWNETERNGNEANGMEWNGISLLNSTRLI